MTLTHRLDHPGGGEAQVWTWRHEGATLLRYRDTLVTVCPDNVPRVVSVYKATPYGTEVLHHEGWNPGGERLLRIIPKPTVISPGMELLVSFRAWKPAQMEVALEFDR